MTVNADFSMRNRFAVRRGIGLTRSGDALATDKAAQDAAYPVFGAGQWPLVCKRFACGH